MIFPATQEISNYFTMREIKHRIDETSELSYVEAGFNGKVVSNVMVRFFSRTDGSDVAVRVQNFGGLSVPEEKRQELLSTLNTLNRTYRFLKFCIAADGACERHGGASATPLKLLLHFADAESFATEAMGCIGRKASAEILNGLASFFTGMITRRPEKITCA